MTPLYSVKLLSRDGMRCEFNCWIVTLRWLSLYRRYAKGICERTSRASKAIESFFQTFINDLCFKIYRGHVFADSPAKLRHLDVFRMDGISLKSRSVIEGCD